MKTLPIKKIIDLNTYFDINDKIMDFYKNFYNIDIVGFRCSKKTLLNHRNSVIFRTKNDLDHNFEKCGFFYLVESNFTGNININYSNTDIITINKFNDVKSLLKKLSGKNLGIEFLLSDLNAYKNLEIGTWIHTVQYFYNLCKKYCHQFIISSGARNIYDVPSSKIFNIFLEKINIDTDRYWNEVNEWLDIKKRGFIYGP